MNGNACPTENVINQCVTAFPVYAVMAAIVQLNHLSDLKTLGIN